MVGAETVQSLFTEGALNEEIPDPNQRDKVLTIISVLDTAVKEFGNFEDPDTVDQTTELTIGQLNNLRRSFNPGSQIYNDITASMDEIHDAKRSRNWDKIAGWARALHKWHKERLDTEEEKRQAWERISQEVN